MADYHFDVREADKYLAEGGLGEVMGFTLFAARAEQAKVQMDTDMALALLMLAQEGLNARTTTESGSA